MVEYLGWIATAVFVGSYFCAEPEMLKRVQMLGALMWVAYGVLIGASPVIAANVLVFARRGVDDGPASGQAPDEPGAGCSLDRGCIRAHRASLSWERPEIALFPGTKSDYPMTVCEADHIMRSAKASALRLAILASTLVLWS